MPESVVTVRDELASIRVDPTVTSGVCAVCRRKPGATEPRLHLDGSVGGRKYKLTICRSCLSEHAPDVLAAIESGSTDDVSYSRRRIDPEFGPEPVPFVFLSARLKGAVVVFFVGCSILVSTLAGASRWSLLSAVFLMSAFGALMVKVKR